MIKRKDFRILSDIHDISSAETDVIDFRSGSSIGPKLDSGRRYEIITLIGTGSLGCVYLVKDHEHSGQLYALKVIHPCNLDTQEKVNSFIQLINELYDLEHITYLKIIDLWQQKNLYFFITKYIDGFTLSEWIEQEKGIGKYISVIDVCDIVLQICEGLGFLHQYGGHGFLHLNNILIDKHKKIKIADFGLRTLFSSEHLKKLIPFAGYEDYLAPEYSDEHIDFSLCDVYFVGILLYEMLTFKQFIENNRVSSIRHDIIPGLDSIIIKATQKNPAERYSDIFEFAEDLKSFRKNSSDKKLRTMRYQNKLSSKVEKKKVQEASQILQALAIKYQENDKKSTSDDVDKKKVFSQFESLKSQAPAEKNTAEIDEEIDAISLDSKEEISSSQGRTLEDIGPLKAIPANQEEYHILDPASITRRLQTKQPQENKLTKYFSNPVNSSTKKLKIKSNLTPFSDNKIADEEKQVDKAIIIADDFAKMQTVIDKARQKSLMEEDGDETQEMLLDIQDIIPDINEKKPQNKLRKYFANAPKKTNFSLNKKENVLLDEMIDSEDSIDIVPEEKSEALLEGIITDTPLSKTKIEEPQELQESGNLQEKLKENSKELEKNSDKAKEEFLESEKKLVGSKEDSKELEENSGEPKEEFLESEEESDNSKEKLKDSKESEESEEDLEELLELKEKSDNPKEELQQDSEEQEGVGDQLVKEVLEEGDQLAMDGLFEEAIYKWHQVAHLIEPIEIEDRLMQVVDMAAEFTQEKMDNLEYFEAKTIIEQVIEYNEDEFVENMYEEILNKLNTMENEFQNAFEQVDNHFEKKQYQAGINILETMKKTYPHHKEVILKKLTEMRQLNKRFSCDEESYMELLYAAKLLEDKGNYQEALQTFEKIRQKSWTCPITDVTKDVERVGKLVASIEPSNEASHTLTNIENLISKGQFTKAKQAFQHPIFGKKLLPKVEKRIVEKKQKIKDLEKKYKKKKLQTFILSGFFLTLVIFFIYMWIYVK